MLMPSLFANSTKSAHLPEEQKHRRYRSLALEEYWDEEVIEKSFKKVIETLKEIGFRTTTGM
ncbi:hypothetical protein [Thermococcus litoralis]|uniref:hypothetical protein n=1 Tax=Thermococcus litoralis TaxID=2265 RepID=UPI000B151C82|nr:hypothetical protein [Thermococcus litoralis]